ncbi:hypothetical protein GCM10010124_04620 [Pilimelia terevasa]|uniref:Cytochrome P450 n=1 Tax=Pilimelia terevasa TaxID=53372 RepID=A0A8J3BMU0_9ACTN|nr:hypothetical protein [Pilimelia terevasa]GGK15114.1 hypothetical protein GCM10010124_04620 [Pilimelia terevasa]
MSRFAVDLSSPRLRGDSAAHTDWLRTAVGPVLPCARPHGVLVLSAALVREVLTDPARYSSAIMSTADTQLLGADGAAHRRVRRTLVRALRTADAAVARRRARARAARLLGAFAAAGGGDAVAAVARPLAVFTAAEVLGLPVPAVRRLTAWAGAAVGAATSARAGGDVGALGGEATAAVRRALGGAGRGLLGTLRAEVAAGTQTEDGALEVALLVLLASLDTTTALVATCLSDLAVGREPAADGAGPDAAADARVGRVLARRPPVRFVRRVATAPHALGAHRVRAGEPVLVHLHSANAEEGGFAFGAGPHACPGAPLARAVAAGALAAAAGLDLRPAGPPVPQDSAQIDGYAALPLHARRREGSRR